MNIFRSLLSTIPLFGIGIEFRPSTSSIIILVPENRGDQQTESLKKNLKKLHSYIKSNKFSNFKTEKYHSDFLRSYVRNTVSCYFIFKYWCLSSL